MSTGSDRSAPRRQRFTPSELEPGARDLDVVDALDLESLTILPSIDTGSWAQVGVSTDVARSLSSASRVVTRRAAASLGGAISVTSGLTTVPPSLRPPLSSRVAPGGVGGGGLGIAGGQGVWENKNAMGKSRRFQLVLVERSMCLGFIGKDRSRICRDVGCKTAAHKVNRAILGCDAAYCIPAARPKVFGSACCAFLHPRLDRSMLVDSVRADLEDLAFERTTREWEAYIANAWHEYGLYERAQEQAAVQPEESSDEDASSEGDVSFDVLPEYRFKTPKEFEWEDSSVSIAEPEFSSELDDDEEKTDARWVREQEIRLAIQDLTTSLKGVASQQRGDARFLLEYIWGSVQTLISEINRGRKHLRSLKADVGDVAALRDMHDVQTVTDGVIEAFNLVLDGAIKAPVQRALDDLTELCGEIDSDHRDATTYALTKINEVVLHVSTLEATAAVRSNSGGVTMSTMISDATGSHVISIGDLCAGLAELRASNTALEARLAGLSSDLASQGGIVMDTLLFTSEAQILELVMKECPSGDAFEVFTDVCSLPCYDSSYDPATNWEKTTKFMATDGQYSSSARKVVVSYNHQQPYFYNDGKTAVAGTRIAAFKSAEVWRGEGGLEGRRHDIETSLASAALVARATIDEKLPHRGKLREVALKMIDKTLNWYATVHRHFDAELQRLSQVHIPEDECLILLSEETILMFTMIHTIRKQRMEFTLKGKRVEYMVRCIWLTLKAHSVMEDFIKSGLIYNPTISAAFIRFLTKQTGQNVSSGIGGQLKTMADALTQVKAAAKEASDAAKEATRASKEASTRSVSATTAADKVSNELKSILAKNSSLKK